MKDKKVLNYTPHPVRLITNSGVVEIPKHGVVRAGVTRRHLEDILIGGVTVPINVTTFGNAVGLPKEVEGTIIIVSSITAYSINEVRSDIYVVDELIREKGSVIGARNLAKYDTKRNERKNNK